MPARRLVHRANKRGAANALELAVELLERRVRLLRAEGLELVLEHGDALVPLEDVHVERGVRIVEIEDLRLGRGIRLLPRRLGVGDELLDSRNEFVELLPDEWREVQPLGRIPLLEDLLLDAWVGEVR